MKSLLLLLAFFLAAPALAQERSDRALAPAGVTVLSTEDQARLDAFLAKRPRTVVAARPADSPRRTPQPPAFDRGAIVFTVDNTWDDSGSLDTNPGDGFCADAFGDCGLRTAVEEANAQPDNQPVRIEFDITAGPAGSEVVPGVWRITLNYDGDGINGADELPFVFQPNLTVDALTQPGASCGDLVDGVKHDLRVILDGSNVDYINGIGLDNFGEGFVVRGLVVQGFPYFGVVAGPNALAECNYVGTDHTGEVAAGNGSVGMAVNGTIRNNLVSANGNVGIQVNGYNDSTPVIERNLIGTDADGNQPLGNALDGLIIAAGGAALVSGNVISANGDNGIGLVGDAFGTGQPNTDVSLYGNLIGLSRTGQSLGLGNTGDGIELFTPVVGAIRDNDIGGPGQAPNWIADNGGAGILIHGIGADDNRVRNNHVGFDMGGSAAPNLDGGIVVLNDYADAPTGTLIGGPTAAEANRIAGNAQHGLRLVEDAGTLVEGNTIGLNHLGLVTPNVRDGIRLDGSVSPTVRENTVVGNNAVGIALSDDGQQPPLTTGAVIQGNFIGTDAAGNATDSNGTTLGNRADGIWCRQAENTLIGGIGSQSESNEIAYNGHGSNFQDGIKIAAPCSEYTIVRNKIYDNIGLGIDLGSEGVTPNDSPEADGFTNYPVITSATNDGATTTLEWTFTGEPFQEYRFSYFWSDTPDPSGYGEGQVWRTGQEITLDASGTTTRTYAHPVLFPVGKWVTMTATLTNGGGVGAFGSTSEFSQAVQVTDVSGPDYDLTATNTSPLAVSPGGSVSFDYSIANNTASAATGSLWFVAERAGSTVAQGVIRSGTIPAGATITGGYTQGVPSTAPSGAYTYRLRIGQFPSPTVDEEVFTVTVTGSARGGGPTEWSLTDATPWEEAASASVSGEAESDPEAASRGAAALPSAAALVGAYPNPFSRRATVAFALPEATRVTLAVYDVLGRAVARLVDGEAEAGHHEAVLDGYALPSGVYLVRLVTESRTETQRITLVR